MASTSLTRTFSAGDNQTFTFSAWIKNADPDYATDSAIFGNYTDNDNFFKIDIQGDNNQFRFFNRTSTVSTANVQISAVTRDVSGWYHLVVAVDTTQATASDRIKIYVNGTLQSSFVSSTYPSQNTNLEVNKAISHSVGAWNSSQYHDGSMSHIHFIDGTAYDATAFGEYDANGVWKIKTSPSVTYGTNGFFILKDGNSVTDQSGNGNNFTVAGGTLTNTEDSPSNVFATINILTPVDTTVSNGNLKYSDTNSNFKGVVGTLGASSGKYYSEVKVVTVGDAHHVGIVDVDQQQGAVAETPGSQSNGYSLSNERDVFNNNGVLSGYTDWTGTYTSGDIIGVAMDLDNNKLYFSKNGQWSAADGTWGSTTFNSSIGDIPINSGVTYTFSASAYNGTGEYNFGNGYFGTTAVASAGTNASGNGIFEYDVPTGYTALSTKGLNL